MSAKPTIDLIHPPPYGEVPFKHLGLAYIAASLRNAGYPTRYHDVSERIHRQGEDFYSALIMRLSRRAGDMTDLPFLDLLNEVLFPEHQDSELAGTIRSQARSTVAGLLGARVVCLSYNTLTAYFTAYIGRELRKNGILVVLGGPIASIESLSHLLLRLGCADCIIQGEGELPGPRAVESLLSGRGIESVPGAIWLENDTVHTNPNLIVSDLDKLPKPLLEGHILDSFLPIQTSRGCPRSCAYCSESGIWGKDGYRLRKVEDILGEMQKMSAEYNLREFHFHDDLINGNRKFLDSFLGQLHGKGFQWESFFEPYGLDKALLAKTVESGCRLVKYGIQSFSPIMLGKMGRSPRPESIISVVVDTYALGMSTHYDMLIGHPGETEDDHRTNLRIVEEIYNKTGDKLYFSLNPFYLAAGSTIYRNPDQFGLRIVYADPSLYAPDFEAALRQSPAYATGYISDVPREVTMQRMRELSLILKKHGKDYLYLGQETLPTEKPRVMLPPIGAETRNMTSHGRPKPSQDPKLPPKDHGLGGKTLAAGKATCAAILRMLALGPPYRVVSAAWVDHALDFAISDGNDQVYIIRIERRTPQSQGLVLTPRLCIFSRSKDLPAELAQALIRAGQGPLKGATTDALAFLVSRDPESGRPGLAMPPSVDDKKRPNSLLDTWGAEDSFADFFAGGEVARSQLDAIDPSKLFHFIQHCDNECLYVNPHSLGAVVTLVNYPWDDRVRSPNSPYDQGLANFSDLDFVEEGMITTDLDENDVIFGNPGKLKALLDHATSRPNPEQKLLFVSNTCVPTVIGDDVESVVKRVRDSTGKQILYLTVSPRSMTNVFTDLLVNRRLKAESEAEEAPPNTVNLIGFSGRRGRTELEELLALSGISVNQRILPDLDTKTVESLPGARLNVLCPNQLWQNLYDQLLQGSRIPHIVAAAPYGWNATREWLIAIAAQFGLEQRASEAFDDYAGKIAPRYEALKDQTKDLRLGFVVRDEQAYYLTSPPSTWGIPLLASVEEMGFGIDILVKASEPQVAQEAARSIRKALKHPDRSTIRAFDSFEFFRQRLKESSAQAFLSYHFFDWRLSEAGKGFFSTQHFEMGVHGAIRTIERLIGIACTPFYSKYSKYLSRSSTGLHKDF